MLQFTSTVRWCGASSPHKPPALRADDGREKGDQPLSPDRAESGRISRGTRMPKTRLPARSSAHELRRPRAAEGERRGGAR